MLAQSTGWATAARECVTAAAPLPVISFGARHVHPDITDVLDYAASLVAASVRRHLPARASPASHRPARCRIARAIFGDTVKAAEAFDRDLGPEVPRIVLVDTFKDEPEETLRVAHALGDRPVRHPARHAVGARRVTPTSCARFALGSTRPASTT
jgi:nicotinate phosphoribosyltransferase